MSSNDTHENKGKLKKQGVGSGKFDYVIALAGNPNTGKSTVFNNLTGLRQHTGNWPGKTVTRAEGAFSYAGKEFKMIDLPGTYSLLSTSTDEEVARNFILFGQPDVTVIVADATRLERNLNLTLQILEITDRAVLCLNLIDEAERKGIKVNHNKLSEELGIPVVPAAARSKQGMDELLEYVYKVASGAYFCRPHRVEKSEGKVKDAITELTTEIISNYPGVPNPRWIAMRLLEGDQRMIDAFESGEIMNLGKERSQREEVLV